jgi:hypothetical protein
MLAILLLHETSSGSTSEMVFIRFPRHPSHVHQEVEKCEWNDKKDSIEYSVSQVTRGRFFHGRRSVHVAMKNARLGSIVILEYPRVLD